MPPYETLEASKICARNHPGGHEEDVELYKRKHIKATPQITMPPERQKRKLLSVE